MEVAFSAFRLMLTPLTAFYTHGPSWAGGWEGASDPTICAHLSANAADARFWGVHADECARMIDRRLASFGYLAGLLAYVGAASTLATRVLVVRPAIKELARALERQRQQRRRSSPTHAASAPCTS